MVIYKFFHVNEKQVLGIAVWKNPNVILKFSNRSGQENSKISDQFVAEIGGTSIRPILVISWISKLGWSLMHGLLDLQFLLINKMTIHPYKI